MSGQDFEDSFRKQGWSMRERKRVRLSDVLGEIEMFEEHIRDVIMAQLTGMLLS